MVSLNEQDNDDITVQYRWELRDGSPYMVT